MDFQTFKDPCHGRRSDFRKMLADLFSLYPECHVFPFADGFQYRQITGIKKVESALGSFLFPPGMTDFIQFLPAAAVIIKG